MSSRACVLEIILTEDLHLWDMMPCRLLYTY